MLGRGGRRESAGGTLHGHAAVGGGQGEKQYTQRKCEKCENLIYSFAVYKGNRLRAEVHHPHLRLPPREHRLDGGDRREEGRHHFLHPHACVHHRGGI